MVFSEKSRKILRKGTIGLTTESVLDIIGETPMLSLGKFTGLNIFAKAEYLNPGGSIKDRVAKYMIEQAEAKGCSSPA